MMNALLGALSRFRKEETAVTCDIEQMFHSFHVNPENIDFPRFLWFKDNNLNGQICEYRMNVHLFGAVSSPAVPNFWSQGKAMCANANLRLHKFASNSRVVLETLLFEDRAKDLKVLDLQRDVLPVQRSLGTYWCTDSDTISFPIEFKDKPLTRRGILNG